MRPGTVVVIIAVAPFVAVVGTLLVILLTGLLIASAGPTSTGPATTGTVAVAP